MPDAYELWYWPEIPGRGEFVRLALEAGKIAYRDCAREKGAKALLEDMSARKGSGPFAPPYLIAGELCLSQTAIILLFLGDRHALGPGDLEQRWFASQLQLTIADMVAEAHNVHHPVSPSKYYKDQKEEAARAADAFRNERIPKFLGYFEDRLAETGGWLTGDKWTYVDLSLFQLIEGLSYAFPRRMKVLAGKLKRISTLRDRVAGLSELADYLASNRRIPFNQDGIFRHYSELDGD